MRRLTLVSGAVLFLSLLAWAGGPRAATQTCGGMAPTLIGTPGNDVLVGTPGDDVIFGDTGQDTLDGGAGNDRLCGGDGDDRLSGGSGNDKLFGQTGLDRADFAGAATGVTVDLAAQTASGEGADSLKTIELVDGSSFADDLYGSAADDGLTGKGGTDLLMGFAGNDSLDGGAGDDILRGDVGMDSLRGGAGTDACVDGEIRFNCERGGGTLRLDLSSDFDYVDPALGSFSHSFQMQNSMCTRLVAHPDAHAPEGSTLVPEAATSLPTISPNGRRYTFAIREGLRFSPPSNQVVTAQTFKFAIERVLHPTMQSFGSRYALDIVGAEEYRAGQATEVSGITAKGMKLSITLVRPKGDFLARLALPFFCAVPTDSPITAVGARLPSAGPYYLAEWNQGVGAVGLRNPGYRGRRASNFDRIEWTVVAGCVDQTARVEAGQTDHGCVAPADRQRVHEAYGPGSPAAAAGRQSYFVDPSLVIWYLALNAERPAFANETLRHAVAYALSRYELAALHGYDGGAATDQILPPDLAGYVDHDVFPLNGDLETAKALAAQAGVTPQTPITVVMYSFNVTTGPAVAQYVQDGLAPLGINVDVQLFDRIVQHDKMATRGEPFDIGLEGWGADYDDPYNFLDMLLNGARLQPTHNSNVSYFDDPAFNARLDAASLLTGAERYATYADLDRDLSAAAPVVPYVNTNAALFFSSRIGCHTFTPLYNTALNALCLRP